MNGLPTGAVAKVHQVVTNNRPKGWAITFSKDFLHHNQIDESFIRAMNIFNHFEEQPPIIVNAETASKLDPLLSAMEDLMHTPIKYQAAALGAYLKLFLIYCDSQCMLHPQASISTSHQRQLITDFKELVTQHFQQWHKVTQYAEALAISSKYLNQLTKSLLGQTAKEVIQEKIILHAKRDLKYSDKSIKEIAYELGFDDPLYFSSFFKKCTGVSPSVFKKV